MAETNLKILKCRKMKDALIFIPNSLDLTKEGYLTGIKKESEDCITYYITKDFIQENSDQSIGYIGCQKKMERKDFLVIDHCLAKVTFISKEALNPIKIIYDYNGIRNSPVLSNSDNYGKHIKNLSEQVQIDTVQSPRNYVFLLTIFISVIDTFLKVFEKFGEQVKYVSILLSWEESLKQLKWFIINFNKGQISTSLKNALFAKLIDLLLGISVVYYLWHYEMEIISFIENFLETTIKSLKELLSYLMGSPIGLKLNFAFNRSLGTFFFYHIYLWRVFLKVMFPHFVSNFKYLVLLNLFGFSFQLSMLTDLIQLATFHVYCIYVYGARLFHLQIRGLISLWRLFLGRKYNPLRQRVDSFQYSQNQLLIGTLAFTILLFLLPTTTMYYTVFTIFRLIVLIIVGLLKKLRIFMKLFPVYIIILWIFNSPQIAGTLNVKWIKKENNVLEVKLQSLPLGVTIKNLTSVLVQETEPLSISSYFHNTLTGIII